MKRILSLLIALILIVVWCNVAARANSAGAARLVLLQQDSVIVSPFEYCQQFGLPGGGPAYQKIITTGDHVLIPDGKSPLQMGKELKQMIFRAKPNQTIYIHPQCTLDIGEPIEVNKTIVLASNRGMNGSEGALIRSRLNRNTLFKIHANGVRFTGLRMEGNAKGDTLSQAVEVLDLDPLNITIKSFEFDNCEVYNWAIGVEVTHNGELKATDDYKLNIHHNFMHDNLFAGYGYGVDVGNAFAYIFGNVFRNNRHDIAGAGTKRSGYEAYCNTILEGTAKLTNFDMHGGDGNKLDYAGGFMKIHHNDFRDLNCQGNIFVVGRPEVVCIISNNRFATPTIFRPVHVCPDGSMAIQNRPSDKNLKEGSPGAYGNIIAVNNIYNGRYAGWYAREDWDKARTDNVMRIPSQNDLLLAVENPELIPSGLVNPVRQTIDYYFADMNGDGRTDIFKADGAEWSYLPLDCDYADQWTPIRSSEVSVATITFDPKKDFYDLEYHMVFVNIDADKRTDVGIHKKDTGELWIFSGGKDLKRVIRNTPPVHEMLTGRFQKKTRKQSTADFLKAGPKGLNILKESRWRSTHVRNVGNGRPLLGDFNGDGCSDVFIADQTGWKYSSCGGKKWPRLHVPQTRAEDLMIVNFDQKFDTTSDVIGLVDKEWKISVNGRGAWQRLTIANFPLENFVFGNLR